MRFTKTLRSLAFAAGILTPAAAMAANAGYATTNVNMRTGPSSGYQQILTIPAGAPVTIYGCTDGYSWCDTRYGNARGWVYSRYLADATPAYRYRPYRYAAPRVGIGVYGYDPHRYYRRHYGHRYRPGLSIGFGFGF